MLPSSFSHYSTKFLKSLEQHEINLQQSKQYSREIIYVTVRVIEEEIEESLWKDRWEDRVCIK